MAHAARGCDLALKCRHLRAQDELPARQHALNRLIDFRLDGLILRHEIDEGNCGNAVLRSSSFGEASAKPWRSRALGTRAGPPPPPPPPPRRARPPGPPGAR